MYRGNAARTGAMPGPGLSGPPTILWQFAPGSSANFAPAIADGVIYLPAEKVLYTADMNVVNANPAQLVTVRAAVQVTDRLNLDYNSYIMAHPANPDRPISKADVVAAAGTK